MSRAHSRDALIPGQTVPFDEWLTTLDETVIQGDYGYEDGEFTVYPEAWEPMWREGLTPAAAFQRALDAHAEAQREEEAQREANWQRIKLEDAAAIVAYRARTAAEADAVGTSACASAPNPTPTGSKP